MSSPVYYFSCIIIVLLSHFPYWTQEIPPKIPSIDWSATEKPKSSGYQPYPGCELFHQCVRDMRNIRNGIYMTNGSGDGCGEGKTHGDCNGGFIAALRKQLQNASCELLPAVKDILKEQYMTCRNEDPETYCLDNTFRWVNRLFTSCTNVKPNPPPPFTCNMTWENVTYDGSEEVPARESVLKEFPNNLRSFDTNGDILINLAAEAKGTRFTIKLIAKAHGNVTMSLQLCESVNSVCNLYKDDPFNDTAMTIEMKDSSQHCPILRLKQEPSKYACRNGLWRVNFTAPVQEIYVTRPPKADGCKMTLRISSANLSKCYFRWDKVFDIDLTALPRDLDMTFTLDYSIHRVKTRRNTTGSRTSQEDGATDEERKQETITASAEASFNAGFDIIEIETTGSYKYTNDETTTNVIDRMKRVEQIKQEEGTTTDEQKWDNYVSLNPGYRHQKEALSIYCTHSAKVIAGVERTFLGDSFEENIADCTGSVKSTFNDYARASRAPDPADHEQPKPEE